MREPLPHQFYENSEGAAQDRGSRWGEGPAPAAAVELEGDEPCHGSATMRTGKGSASVTLKSGGLVLPLL